MPTKPKTRAQLVAAAKKQLAKIEPKYQAARAALGFAENTLDVGERVLVQEPTCRRGCCMGTEFEVTVVGRNDKDPNRWQVAVKNGGVVTVDRHHIRRKAP